MFIYNVTIKVDWSIHDEWLQWMKEQEIPGMLGSGFFYNSQMVRLLEVDEEDGPTYAIQYHALSKADYNRYVELHASEMRKKSFEKWGEQFIAFRSLMQVVK